MADPKDEDERGAKASGGGKGDGGKRGGGGKPASTAKWKLCSLALKGGDGKWHVILHVEGGDPPARAKATVDLYEEGAAVQPVEVEVEGAEVLLPFRSKARMVQFRVRSVIVKGALEHPAVATDPLVLEAVVETPSAPDPGRYVLNVLPYKGDRCWILNLNVYRTQPGKISRGVQAIVDVFDEGQPPKPVQCAADKGVNVPLPLRRTTRSVRCSIQQVEITVKRKVKDPSGAEASVREKRWINPDAHTQSVELKGVPYAEMVQEHAADPKLGLIGNVLKGMADRWYGRR